MADDGPFHSVQHPTTRRWAVLEDDGTSVWMVVTEQDAPRPIADCFVYNCHPPADQLPESWDRSGPPPITSRYASPMAHRPGLSADRVRLAWTRSGNAAAVLVDGEPIAFLVVGEKQGHSRGIAMDGPYGHPWDDVRFAEVFHDHLTDKPGTTADPTG